ncbi:MAG: rhodanese-like domain-containing protein [Chloroflexi bacterium]|nr:rhodanese-like domain-containing protein [Chloroflexota bacterium]
MNKRTTPTPLIRLEEAKAHLDAGDAIFVDTRPREEYEQSHVPSALLMPITEVPRRYQELPRDRLIITYCT